MPTRSTCYNFMLVCDAVVNPNRLKVSRSLGVVMDADLDAVAAELYALAPKDFVSARTVSERQARAAGQRELAAAIHRMGKPTTVAWLANQLVRQHPEQLGPFLELGSALRDATATLSGDDLRRLSRQQHEVINALIGQARVISVTAGQDVTEATSRGLEATLRAALADRDMADQLASGRLTGPLTHAGFGDFPSPAPAAPAPVCASAPIETDRRRAEREKAEAELAKAQEASDEAARKRPRGAIPARRRHDGHCRTRGQASSAGGRDRRDDPRPPGRPTDRTAGPQRLGRGRPGGSAGQRTVSGSGQSKPGLDNCTASWGGSQGGTQG